MSLPFDATLKNLVREYRADWLAQLDAGAAGPLVFLTTDLSTVTAFADLVLKIGEQYLLHLDFQTGPDPRVPWRTLLYNVLLHDRSRLPVHSIIVLMRPRADHADLTGRLQ